VCIQETKLQRIDASTVASFLGQEFAKNITVLPAQGTRGVLACSGSQYVMSQVVIKEYSMTATITSTADNTVYGPQDTAEKQQFMQELQQCKPTIAARWIFMGDFNLIYRACDSCQALDQYPRIWKSRNYSCMAGGSRGQAARLPQPSPRSIMFSFPKSGSWLTPTVTSKRCLMLITYTPLTRWYKGV
jgi:exonuclease III